MNLEEYSKKALVGLNPIIAKPNNESRKYSSMGLIEETGEVVAEFRKSLYKGNFHERKLNKEAIKEEIGDMIWYMALICKNNNIPMKKLEPQKIDNCINVKRLKKIPIRLGENSGQISKRYRSYSKGKIKKKRLIKSLQNQYKKILELIEILDIPISEILERNVEKVNNRYTKEGISKNIGVEKYER